MQTVNTGSYTHTHTLTNIHGTCSLVKCCHFSRISWSRSQRSSVQRQMAAQRSPNTWTHVHTSLIRGLEGTKHLTNDRSTACVALGVTCVPTSGLSCSCKQQKAILLQLDAAQKGDICPVSVSVEVLQSFSNNSPNQERFALLNINMLKKIDDNKPAGQGPIVAPRKLICGLNLNSKLGVCAAHLMHLLMSLA